MASVLAKIQTGHVTEVSKSVAVTPACQVNSSLNYKNLKYSSYWSCSLLCITEYFTLFAFWLGRKQTRKEFFYMFLSRPIARGLQGIAMHTLEICKISKTNMLISLLKMCGILLPSYIASVV
jgi:hypothetical protein